MTAETAGGQGIEVGDEVQVVFWWLRDELTAEPDQVVTPAGVERLRVVGIATLPDEALPDELYSRSRMLVSPDVAARYDCWRTSPAGRQPGGGDRGHRPARLLGVIPLLVPGPRRRRRARPRRPSTPSSASTPSTSACPR